MARKKAGEARDAAEAGEDRSAILTDERSEDASTPVTDDDAVAADERVDDDTRADDASADDVEDDDVEDDDDRATETVDETDHVEDDDEVEDTDDELDDDDDDDDDEDEREGVARSTFFATLGVAVVAVIGVLFLLGAYVWPAILGPGSPEDTGNQAVSALSAKDPGQLGAISCVRLDGTPAASFPPELLALVGKAAPAGPSKQTLDTEARVPVDLTLTQGGQSQTLPADLLLGVNHGDWCLNGISQRQ